MSVALPEAVQARLRELAAELPPEALAEVARRVREQHAELLRARAREQFGVHDSPGKLAVELGQQQTKHLAILDGLHERARAGEPVRAIVALPPRHGKTDRLVKVGNVWRLDDDPDCRIMAVSGAKETVTDASRWVRDELERNDRPYRVRPRRDVRSVSSWQIEGHRGGMLVGSIGSRIIGKGANLLEVDDLIGSPKEAESPLYRESAWRFLQSAFGRLEPRAAVFVVNSRWHADDPIGRLLKEQPGRWEYWAIPATAEQHGPREDPDDPRCICGDLWNDGHTDPLGRDPGEALWPERYDVVDLEARRLEFGSHYYAAQYQQRPRRREGGLWREEWISDRRGSELSVAECLDQLTVRTVAVDPSASDEDDGDEAGIVCGGKNRATGDAVITHDLSARYTPEGWARTALVAAIELAADVVYERNLTPAFMRRAFATAWRGLVDEATANEGKVEGVLGEGLVELPKLMPRLIPVSAKVGKELRAGPVAQRYEQRKVVHAGVFLVLEDQLLTWRPADRDSPDRLDALVHLVSHLGDLSGNASTMETATGTVPTGAGAAASDRYR